MAVASDAVRETLSGRQGAWSADLEEPLEQGRSHHDQGRIYARMSAENYWDGPTKSHIMFGVPRYFWTYRPPDMSGRGPRRTLFRTGSWTRDSRGWPLNPQR